MFKKPYINILFTDTLEQMLSYVKFMKDILSKTQRMSEFETVSLTKECSVILQWKRRSKLKNLGNFSISCRISNHFFGEALCDLRAIINLMPLFSYKKLNLWEAKTNDGDATTYR